MMGRVGWDRLRPKSLGATALVIAGLTVLSSLTGFVRELLIGRRFGASGDTDAFFAAFTTVSFVFLLLTGGALQGSFMPAYQRLRSRGDIGAARSLLVWTSVLIGGFGGSLAVILYLGAEPLISILYPGFDSRLRNTGALALQILSPIAAIAPLGNLAQSVFNARSSYFAPAAMPVLTNLVVVGFLVVTFAGLGVQSLTLGYLVGYLPWLALLAWTFAERGTHPRAIDASVQRTMLTSLTLLGMLAVFDQLSSVVQRSLLSWFEPGILSTFAYGSRLAGIPISVIVGALGVVLFPRFVAVAATNKNYGKSDIIYVSIAATLTVIVPVSLFMAIDAGFIVRFLFSGSAMDAAAMERLDVVFITYSLALPAQALIIILSRIYMAANKNHALLVISAAFGAIHILLTYLATKWLGWQGVPIATFAYSYLFCTVLLIYLTRFNPMRTAVYARGGAVILIAALLSSAVGLLALGDGVVSSAAGGLGMAGTFLICCLTLGEKSVLQLFRYGRS
ncbi:hypothetical protein BwSH20_47720 [Bradyrhizobium ottawaense]|nr:hypothetical protein TM233_20790 [Bradyrhizobium sp. TM233]GMO77864.1 hypothetical protein BwSG20_52910 [Bradyrhizobium ottawaense]GMP06011.1 hypothetical protein BwSH20_47720 [Bradyrhizobium ottawaense]